MKAILEGQELVIRIPITEPTLSPTGKTYSIASSHGNVKTDVMIEGKPLTIGLNAYISAK